MPPYAPGFRATLEDYEQFAPTLPRGESLPRNHRTNKMIPTPPRKSSLKHLPSIKKDTTAHYPRTITENIFVVQPPKQALYNLEHYPDDFHKGTNSSTKLHDKLDTIYGVLVPKDLPITHSRGHILIPTPVCSQSTADHAPPYLLIRIDKVYNNLKKSGIKIPQDRNSWSLTDSVHLGICITTPPQPFPTSPTMNQTPAVKHKLNKLRGMIQEVFSQKLCRIMAHYLPKQLEKSDSIVKSDDTSINCSKKDKLDFGPTFFTVAVKSGSSEILHLDMMDDAEDFTWIAVVGDFTGGYFYAPQFGIRIPDFDEASSE
ncbi:hypothetical protein C8J56DRAFT_1094410 [Mycena floridula]|nr:hypothetical protein C8J56DRAFT_1094410 [Mycena floridula]